LEALRKALKLPDTAKDEEVVAAAVGQQGMFASIGELAKALGMPEDASPGDVIKKAVAKLKEAEELKKKVGEMEKKSVAAKDIREALGLTEAASDSETIASIHALKQTPPDVTKELIALKNRLAERDRDDMVKAAMTAGKITPAQKEWAEAYALKDPEGFKIFVEKAAQVVPVEDVKVKPDDKKAADPVFATIAASMGLTKEDIEKYAPREVE
jgi:phage I-like protein